MKKVRLISYFYIICFLLILFSQGNCNNTTSNNIKLYIYENNNIQKLNSKLFITQKPVLVLDEKAIHKVQLIQRKKDSFAIEIELSKKIHNELEKITSVNIGKRLVFMSNTQLLFAPLILEAIQQGKIVIELPSMRKTDAEKIARYFSSSFEFISNELYISYKLNPDFKKAYEFRNRGEHDRAIEVFKQILKQKDKKSTKISLYNEIALSYRLKGDKYGAAKTYKQLINEPVNINLNNYMMIAQAYFYLSQFEKEQGNIDISKNYFNKGIAILEYIVKNFPTTKSAEWASLTIGTYELLRGNIIEAQNRAIIAKQGDFKAQGYLLFGLCYEYQKEFEKARKEYKRLIKDLPNSDESKIAQEFIRNLDNNKTNIEEFLKTLSLSF
jgi:tetratricopeptide (TPR) repeat protein